MILFKSESRLQGFFLFLFLVLFVGFALVFPFGTLLQKYLAQSQTLLFDRMVLHSVVLTLTASVIALVFSTALALPLALALFHSKTVFSKSIQSMLEVLWIFPSFLFVLATLYILKFFEIEQLYSIASVLLAWILIGTPYLAVQFLNGLRDLDVREREALQTLGAGRTQELFYYDLPKLRRVVASALMHQFWLYLTSFVLVVLLSGGPPNETLEVSIYHAIRLDRVNWSLALALSLWQATILFGVRFVLQRWLEKTETQKMALEWFRQGRTSTYRKVAVIFLSLTVFALLVFSPTDLIEATLTGFALSSIVAFFTLLFTLFVYSFRMRWLAEIGAWVSPMVLAMAWWKSYRFSLPPLLTCAALQVILLAPWVARSLFPLLARERRLEREAVRTLGASKITSWILVEWPRLRSTVWWLGALIFALSLAEVSSVILFSSSDFLPLSVSIQNSLSRFRLDEAFYGTSLLILISTLGIFAFRGKHAA